MSSSCVTSTDGSRTEGSKGLATLQSLLFLSGGVLSISAHPGGREVQNIGSDPGVPQPGEEQLSATTSGNSLIGTAGGPRSKNDSLRPAANGKRTGHSAHRRRCEHCLEAARFEPAGRHRSAGSRAQIPAGGGRGKVPDWSVAITRTTLARRGMTTAVPVGANDVGLPTPHPPSLPAVPRAAKEDYEIVVIGQSTVIPQNAEKNILRSKARHYRRGFCDEHER